MRGSLSRAALFPIGVNKENEEGLRKKGQRAGSPGGFNNKNRGIYSNTPLDGVNAGLAS